MSSSPARWHSGVGFPLEHQRACIYAETTGALLEWEDGCSFMPGFKY